MSKPKQKNKLLLHAAAGGDLTAVSEALARGASPHSTERFYGYTALMLAVISNRVDCVRALLPVSDPRTTNLNGKTPLMIAAEKGNLEIFDILLPVSDPYATDCCEWSALMSASASGSIDMVKRVLSLLDPSGLGSQLAGAESVARMNGASECADFINAFAKTLSESDDFRGAIGEEPNVARARAKL